MSAVKSVRKLAVIISNFNTVRILSDKSDRMLTVKNVHTVKSVGTLFTDFWLLKLLACRLLQLLKCV